MDVDRLRGWATFTFFMLVTPISLRPGENAQGSPYPAAPVSAFHSPIARSLRSLAFVKCFIQALPSSYVVFVDSVCSVLGLWRTSRPIRW